MRPSRVTRRGTHVGQALELAAAAANGSAHMNTKRRPSGRDGALAQATLAIMDAHDKAQRETAAPPAIVRGKRLTGVRLIDLERRARFVRFAS